MDTIVETEVMRATEEDRVITLSSKGGHLLFGLGVLAVVFGVLIYFLSRLPISNDRALEALMVGSAAVIVPAGVLLLLLAVFNALFKRKIIFDCNKQLMQIGWKEHDFFALGGFRLAVMPIGTRQLYILVAIIDGKDRRLISDFDELPVRMLVEYLNDKVVLRAMRPAAAAANGSAPAMILAGRRFLAMILLGMGAVWAASGYYFYPDVIFVRTSSDPHGPLVWPLGIWIGAIGLAELIGIPLWRWLMEGGRWRRIGAAAMFLGPYFFICWR